LSGDLKFFPEREPRDQSSGFPLLFLKIIVVKPDRIPETEIHFSVGAPGAARLTV